jgi:hypothetical protein
LKNPPLAEKSELCPNKIKERKMKFNIFEVMAHRMRVAVREWIQRIGLYVVGIANRMW